jgi:hypothetical protein
VRFWLDGEGDMPGDCIGLPFFSLIDCRFMPVKEAALFEFQVGSIVIQGPKSLDFFQEFCRQRATCVKADGKDILSVTLIVPQPPEQAD